MTLQSALDELIDGGRRRPDAPAFVDVHDRITLTHGGLARRIEERAGALTAAGLGPGGRLAFGVRQGPEGVAWLLACLRAGLAVVVLDPGVGLDLLATRCRAAGVQAVLLDRAVASLAGTRPGRWVASRLGIRLPDPRRLAGQLLLTGPALVRGAVRLDRVAGPPVRADWGAEDAALALFTSGTTSAPRGVVHTPRSLAATLHSVRDLAGLDGGSRVLASGLHLVVPALLAGGAAVAAPARPAALARATRNGGLTHVVLAPHLAVAWSEAGGAPPTLRRLYLGSAPLRNAAVRRILPGLPPSCEAWGIYGMSEMLLVSAIRAQERLSWNEADGDLVGAPIPGARVRIAADGEVWVAGPGLARGYLGEPPARELRSGDVGRLDDRGQVVLLGRRKEMLIRRGENIYPGLYEATLVERARLGDAALVGVPDRFGDERAVLCIVPGPGDPPELAVTRVRRLVAGPETPFDEHARPDEVIALEALPRAGRSAKIDRRALARLAARRLGLDEPNDPILAESS